ncbi:MAG: ROK family protein [Sphingobium sp.]|nr:ROK family protein [Sphingobium sp.]
MPAPDIVTALICAIEDDCVVFMDVDFQRKALGWGGARVGEAQAINRTDFDPHSIEDDQHKFNFKDLVSQIITRLNAFRGEGRNVRFVSISTFGNVDMKTGNVAYRPLDFDKPKNKYETFPFRNDICRKFEGIEVIIENDASASALGEYVYGRCEQNEAFAYVWAGRGVNAGIVLDGYLWKGKLHPEAGHIPASIHPDDTLTKGACSSHNACILGFASQRAINVRLQGDKIKGKPKLDKVLDWVAGYYAQLCMSITMIAATERIAIGGHLINHYPQLIGKIQDSYGNLVGGYPAYSEQLNAKTYITCAVKSHDAALWGMVEATRRHLNGN